VTGPRDSHPDHEHEAAQPPPTPIDPPSIEEVDQVCSTDFLPGDGEREARVTLLSPVAPLPGPTLPRETLTFATALRGNEAAELDAEDIEPVEPIKTPRSVGVSLPPPPPRVSIAPGSRAADSKVSLDLPKKRIRGWWDDVFCDDLLRTQPRASDDTIRREVGFIEESLAVVKGGRVLDLACGVGRHALEMTRRGYELVGLDLGLAMLALAAEEAEAQSAQITFVQADMRELAYEEHFDGIYCWNTSFGYFDDESNLAVLDRVRRSLKRGGQFLLDVTNRDYLARHAPALSWFEGDGCVCMDEMQFDWVASRMRVKRTVLLDDGRSRELEYNIRLYSLHELGKLLHDIGFRVAEVSGTPHLPGVHLGGDSPRTIILAEKR
jgi:SAM-dependent methyltransferase